MIRTQVQFTPEQIRWLREQAAATGNSISEVIRRALEESRTRQYGPSREDILKRALSVSGTLDMGAEDVSVEHDKYLAGGSHK